MLSSASQWFMNIQEALRRSDQGADLQAFAEELEAIGVTHCHTYLGDGSTCYYGPSFFRIEGPAVWSWTTVAHPASAERLYRALSTFLDGRMDRNTFLHEAAGAGVEVLTFNVTNRTLTFLDKEGSVLAVEPIVPFPARSN